MARTTRRTAYATTSPAERAERAFEAWVRRVNPRLDRRGVHDAFLAGYHRAQQEAARDNGP